MNQSLPVTIYKSTAGLVGIFLLGVASLVLLLWGFYSILSVPNESQLGLLIIGVLCTAIVAAFFIIWLRTYSISHLTLTQDGLVAVNWKTLFVKQDVQAEWVRVQDVSVVASGFFAQMLGFASLNIQTAGTTQAVRLTMLPNAEYWQEVIAYYADISTQDGMDLSTNP